MPYKLITRREVVYLTVCGLQILNTWPTKMKFGIPLICTPFNSLTRTAQPCCASLIMQQDNFGELRFHWLALSIMSNIRRETFLSGQTWVFSMPGLYLGLCVAPPVFISERGEICIRPSWKFYRWSRLSLFSGTPFRHVVAAIGPQQLWSWFRVGAWTNTFCDVRRGWTFHGDLRPLLRARNQGVSTTIRLHCCIRSGRAFALSTTGIGQALVLSETERFAWHHDQTRDRPRSFFTLALQKRSNACLLLFDRNFSMACGPLEFNIDCSRKRCCPFY